MTILRDKRDTFDEVGTRAAGPPYLNFVPHPVTIQVCQLQSCHSTLALVP